MTHLTQLQLRQAVLVFGCFFLLYASTAAPSIAWEDSAAYHRLAAVRGPADGGMPVYRPYFFLLRGVARLPIGGAEQVSLKLNLFHALLSALSLVVLFCLVQRLTGNVVPAWAAVVALGVSHLFWHYGTVTKVYPLLILAMLLAWHGAVRWALDNDSGWGAIAGFCCGLGAAIHPLFLLSLPGLAVIAFFSRRNAPAREGDLSRLLPVGIGLAAGISLLVYFYAYELANAGLGATLRLLLFSGHGDLSDAASQGSELASIRWSRLPLDALEWGGFLGYQFLLAVPVGLIGFRELIRRQPAAGWGLLTAYLTNVAVAFDFNVPLKINFYFPSFVLFAVAVGFGFERISSRPGARPWRWIATHAAMAPAAYALFTFGVLEKTRPAFLYGRPDAAYKDRGRFYFWPPKNGFREPDAYAVRALAAFPPKAFVLADFQERDVLRYFQDVHRRRTDCTIRHVPLERDGEKARLAVRRAAGKQPVLVGHVYAAAFENDPLFRLVPAGIFAGADFYQVVPR